MMKCGTCQSQLGEPGADVLLVAVQILDLVSRIPRGGPSGDTFYLNEVGEATLVLEFRDSMAETVLVRADDWRTAENMERSVELNVQVTNTAEVRRLFRSFARMLRQRLDEFGGLGP